MVVCVILAKVLGIVYVIPLTRLIGSEGLGIYQNGYSLYVILLTLATSGFPTAMGKLISERIALRKYAEVEQVFRVTLSTVAALAVVFALITWFGAPLYSHLVALKDTKGSSAALIWSVRALAPAVLIVPFLSALRGYMQGFQWMDWSGYSQTIEQLFRVIAMLVGAAIAIHWFAAGSLASIASGTAAATFGAFVGAAAGLVLLTAATFKLRREIPWQNRSGRTMMTNRQMRRQLLHIALPVCAGSMVVPISNFADSVTVQNFLMVFNHQSYIEATRAFGILSRQAFTLIQLPLAFALAIGSSVLPAIAAARARRNQREIQRTVENTFKSMFFITLPMAAVFLVLARPLDILLFGSTAGAVIIQSISFMGIFSGLEQVSTYMLQGLGYMYRPVRNLFLGVIVKVLFNLLLIPHFEIMGAAVATTIGYLVSATLNVLAVKKYGRVHFSVLSLLAPSAIASLLILIPLWLIRWGMEATFHVDQHVHDILGAAGVTVIAVGIAGLIYLAMSIRFHVVSANELRQIPALGRRLARIAERVQAKKEPLPRK